MPPPLIVLVGTTASGKSELGILLAERFGGEIVSADSRQVYTGLDIGTGKVTGTERARVPHHLLDVADVRQRFTVATYQHLALDAIAAIRARGKIPFLVGGSGLYVRAVVDLPAYPQVAPHPELRAELESTPLPTLVERLRTVDPVSASRIDLKNPRRVVRALEVSLVSGIPFSEQQRQRPVEDHTIQLGLTWPRDAVRQRIDARVDARLAAQPSMLDEVRTLLANGVPVERLLELGLEYRFLAQHLTQGAPLDSTIGGLKSAIYQFSRRQLTWFGADSRIRWLDPTRASRESLDIVQRALESADG
jgi:tRNA dimethylallyltransferase